jgi:hypothetical protein
MLARIRPQLFRLLRIPHEPEPPLGAPGSIRVFRAGRNFYYVRLLRWGLTQLGAAVGLAFSLLFVSGVRDSFDNIKQEAPVVQKATATDAPSATVQAGRKNSRAQGRDQFHAWVRRHAPDWTMDAVAVLELLAVAGFVLQLPFTFAAVRLDFEQHWYIVTDRSLRIRTGLVRLQESTMSFANLQQVEVRQGPLQRLLGIADVQVRSAGGGGDTGHKGSPGDTMHQGIFHGVDNAHEIRDLILNRLRRFRAAGLGDPDDQSAAAPDSTSTGDTLAAAHELLAEARQLRATLAPAAEN